jgi:putative hydrolase of the HAD superfamily
MFFTTLLIDLDETLYPAGCGVWEAIADRIEQYMHLRLGVPREEIPALRRSLFHEYGTTLRGLQATREVDSADFLRFVHDVPLDSMIQPDLELHDVLLRYPQRRMVFTNADRRHAKRVLAHLQMDSIFAGIIDIWDIAPYCKPMPEAYHAALRLAGEPDPARVVFIDDSPRNLAGARAAGLYTVQVGSPKTGFQQSDSGAHCHIARLNDLLSVLAPGDELRQPRKEIP